MTTSTELTSHPNKTATLIHIDGICYDTVLTYMNTLNAGDFEALVALFTPDGSLKPPFEPPLVGRGNILSYLRKECQNLKLLPEQGVSEPVDNDLTLVKVTGRVQVPWLGAGIAVNVAWEFLLNSGDDIVQVTIKLLASPQELLKLKR